jgi:deoxyribodipyrimidine photolyase-related protein
MEFFYREMRRARLLMDGDEPVGGQWNFDHDNRKACRRGVKPPKRLRFEPDAITREVMAMVAAASPIISAISSPSAGRSRAPMRWRR